MEAKLSLIEPPEKKRKAKEIHIFADEDHVHMQRPRKEKGKKNKIVPLITISEGIEEVSRTRNKLKVPMHFASIEMTTANLWEEVGAYIEMAYEEDEERKIYIHGDGGNWIKSGKEVLGNSIGVMDGFHIERVWKRLNRIYEGKKYGTRLRAYIEGKNQEKVKFLLKEIEEEVGTEKEKLRAKGLVKYIRNNIREIGARYTEKTIGSCTEAQVSHILSERLSRSPMGWSVEGLAKMVKLRTYIKNGQKVSRKSFEKEDNSKAIYKDYWNMYEDRLISKKRDWSVFEEEHYNLAEQSATRILVNAYGKVHRSA